MADRAVVTHFTQFILWLTLLLLAGCTQDTGAPIRVGVLHSLTGTMAQSEQPVVDATLMAIDEINKEGGLLGRQIEPVVVDGRSDWEHFAREAERLISEERVEVVFGCWTSACRKSVLPVFERHDHLLVYPLPYEGLEQSPNILYTGATPNQQIIPAIQWAAENIGNRFYLIGSDYIYPRTANLIIRDVVNATGGEILGERYIPLGSQEVETVIDEITASRPDVIINTINGDSNIALFTRLQARGITAESIPTLSFSIAEGEIAAMKGINLSGHYAAWNYFQSIDSEANRDFVQRFKKRYGEERTISDPMEAAYIGVNLWAATVRLSRSSDSHIISKTITRQSFAAPEGLVSVDVHTRHLWKPVRLGRINAQGQFDIVWSSNETVRPVPFPSYKNPRQWQEYQLSLYQGWGGHWSAPSQQAGHEEDKVQP
jgi:urea transport system substrate-binding protein